MASKNKWATNWLGIIGIPSNRIIEGTIAANTLIVPEMGRCGAPSLAQINFGSVGENSIKQVVLLDAMILTMPAPCGPIIIEALANRCNCSGIDGRELSSCKTKDRQSMVKRKKNKWTNNDLQNISAQKTKD
jgi:hypothetical protein